MQTLRSLLAVSCLVIPTLGGPAAAETPGIESVARFHIDRQLVEIHRQLEALAGSPRRAELAETIGSLSKELETLQRLHLAVTHGSPIRSEAQLHFRLIRLRGRLRPYLVDLSPATILAPLPPALGTFSGTVTGSQAPDGIEGVFIDIFDAGGEWVASVDTDSNGDYTTPNLAPGDYYARTNDMTGYINELYDDVPCYFICDILGTGQPITVVGSSDTPDVDFELELGNTISGLITDENTALPIEGVTVDIFDENGVWVTNPASDASGDYASPGMPAGTYYAVTFNLAQYLNERFDDQPCLGFCDPLDGSTIEITAGSDTLDIDFALVRGGSISGAVTADPSGTAIENVVVEIYESNGDWRGTGWSDIAGNYITGGGLPASTTYRALTFAPPPFLNELYDDQPCFAGCDIASGTPIVVAAGSETSGRNFALASGGTFSGLVSDGVNGLGEVGIEVRDAGGKWAGFTVTSSAIGDRGRFTSPGLPTGSYFALTFAPPPYLNELFDDIPCSFCDVTAGTVITVTTGADTENIDFVLDTGGYFSGTITDSDSGDELQGIIVDIFDATGTWLANPSSDNLGRYTSPGLSAGDYYARTWNTAGYVNERYDNQPCPPNCDPVTDGTAVPVQVGVETSGIDFALDPGGAISGTVIDKDTTQPVAGMTVEIWDANGEFASAAVSDASGDYEITGLPDGVYFALTWNDLGYPGALYAGYPCAGCEVRLGTPIAVTAGSTASNIDFALGAGGFVEGRVTSGGGGVADVHIELWTSSGHLATWQPTQANGRYTTEWALAPGSYFVKTWNDLGLINEVYPDKPCGLCEPTHGSAIVIEAGATTSGVDFALTAGGSISGAVTLSDPSDTVLPNVQVYDQHGDWLWTQTPESNGTYTIALGLPTGTYYARTAGGRPYVNEVWNNRPCLTSCDVVADGQPIQVTAPGTTANVNFSLAPGIKLTGSVRDATTQEAIDDSVAGIFDTSGEQVAGCRVGAAGAFTCWQAIPPGTYYAATTNYAGYVDEVYSNPRMTCVGGGRFCDVTQGDPIVVDLAAAPDPLDFTLDKGGWFTGSVIDALDRRGLAGTPIAVYNHRGAQVTEIAWQQPVRLVPDGAYSSCGLPAGTYYALTDSLGTGRLYADQLFDSLPCVHGCDPLSGSPITVVPGAATSGVDFELLGRVFGDGFESQDTNGWTYSQ